MSLLNCSRVSNKLTHMFGLVLLCVGYFNSFLISEPISIFLQISYLTGRALVSKFLIICDYTVEIVKLTYSFFQILYEDSLIFIKDATEKFTFALSLLKECYLFLERGVQIVYSFGEDTLKVVFGVLEAFVDLGKLIFFVVSTTKQTLHVTGSAIWSFIISIPETVRYKVSCTNDFILNTISEVVGSFFQLIDKVLQSIHRTYHFLFDIPLDSIYGLIIGGIVLAMLCMKFKDICFIIYSVFVKLYKFVISLGVSLWTGRFLEGRSRRNSNYMEDDERLCVICQYQLKEIIIFPCKHLCLCSDCNTQLLKTQPNCPICRTHIRETIKVYL